MTKPKFYILYSIFFTLKMRKNIFLYIPLLLLILTKTQISFGLFSDPLWLDLYKNIDRWIYDLELKYVDRELKWWDTSWSIMEELKKVEELSQVTDCYDIDFKTQDIKNIATDQNNWIELLFNKLEKCQVDWALDIKTLTEYQTLIANYYNKALESAQNKVWKTYEVSRIWLYSDWNEENSPFDIMLDMQDIDKIIFETETEYNWVNNYNMDNVVDSLLSWENMTDSVNYWQYKSTVNSNYSYNWNKLEETDWSNLVCKIDESWLSEDEINKLLNWSWTTNSWSSWWYYSWKNYSKVNDNAVWPCSNFFCITIEFETYTHNLLWWGKWKSIEWFLKKSNEHLKKFANSSLVQAKMTINLFELWLKDLNLADIFHMWVQVSYKPVPILNLDKNNENWEEDEDNSDFSWKNLLYRYYENLWLDYERANDLEIFQNEENEFKSIMNKSEMEANEAAKNYEELKAYQKVAAVQNAYLSSTVIDKKILTDDLSDFYNQFVELETFVKAMMDYSLTVNWVIKKMDKIPNK